MTLAPSDTPDAVNSPKEVLEEVAEEQEEEQEEEKEEKQETKLGEKKMTFRHHIHLDRSHAGAQLT